MEEEEDYYQVLGISPTATKDEISKAYKKLSLKHHPDKAKGDPKEAAKKFHQIHKAYEILTDEKAKAAFDNVIRAKLHRKKRDAEMDSKRKAMKEQLEERERQAKRQRTEESEAKKRLQQEIERLRQEGYQKLKKMEEEKQKKAQQSQSASTTTNASLFGEYSWYTGFSPSGVEDIPPNSSSTSQTSQSTNTTKPTVAVPSAEAHSQFEADILQKMRQAAAKQKQQNVS